MALRLQLQTDIPSGSLTDADITALGLANFRLRVGYSHPRELSFTAHAPEHTQPIPIGAFLKFWDDDDDDTILFEGFVETVVSGGESNSVQITALDPTAYISRRYRVHSHAYSGTDPASNSTPRLVCNVTVGNDDDYMFSRVQGATVGDIIGTIAADMAGCFTACNAGETDSDDLAGLDFIPQEKQVFDNVGPRQAFDQLLALQPSWKQLWYPGERVWRFGDITAATQTTFTLNHRGESNVVLSLDLRLSLEGRATAIQIYGPRQGIVTVASTADGSLTDISDGPLLETYGGGIEVWGKNKWQVTDSTKRDCLRLLPSLQEIQVDSYSFIYTRALVLRGYFPANRTRPVAHWRQIPGFWYEPSTGVISVAPYANEYESNPRTGEPRYNNPTIVQFIYARQDVPLKVRIPETGFSGEAYDQFGLEVCEDRYEEMLAVSTQPIITTSTRLAAYGDFATYLHRMKSRPIYAGSVVLDGLKYDFVNLNKRINVTATDEDGDPVTTGWESMQALLTDVEYDFEELTTTLTVSSDYLDLVGIDPDELKKRLKIRALQQRQLPSFAWIKTTVRNRRIGETGRGGFSSQWNVHETQTGIAGGGAVWVDPLTGELG